MIVTTDTLVELAGLVLKNNISQFSDKAYKQIRGTAIGTKLAPPYAVFFMAALEEKILSKVKKETECLVEVYCRHTFYLGTW